MCRVIKILKSEDNHDFKDNINLENQFLKYLTGGIINFDPASIDSDGCGQDLAPGIIGKDSEVELENPEYRDARFCLMPGSFTN